MLADEDTPLLREEEAPKKLWHILSSPRRVLFAAFLISVALSFTQVPMLYVFRLMECEEFYRHHVLDASPDRCNRNEVDAGTAAQVSILGLSTTVCGVLNLFYAGWQIRNWGPRAALVVQTAFPSLRVAIQVVGVTVGAKAGIIIVQASQIISLIGGMSGYLLVLNTIAGEIVPAEERTGMFGMLQGSVMLGTSVGYLLGGIIGDSLGIRRPFEIATILFALSAVYSLFLIPYIDPKDFTNDSPGIAAKGRKVGIAKVFDGLGVLLPAKLVLRSGLRINHYGIPFLALGVFMGVLATGYAPMLIQMYATARFKFQPTQNGYLMATNSLIRSVFLIFLFPKIISTGRKWVLSRRAQAALSEAPPVPLPGSIGTHVESDGPAQDPVGNEMTIGVSGQAFDLLFLRWSLVVDGLVTASAALATDGWHIYIVGFLLPLASGSAPASKGVITEMCSPSKRADALQAMTLVENVAMLSTLGLFGFIFSAFSNIGKAYLVFYCNAAVALAAVAVLLFSHFPPEGSSVESNAVDSDEED